MAVADLLEKIGEGAKTVGRVAGAVAEPLAKRTAEVVSGEAPEIDQEKRARAEKLEDEQTCEKSLHTRKQPGDGPEVRHSHA